MTDLPTQKRLVIHLGYHKTGSSSIQRWLADHAEELSGHMTCYNLVDGTANPLKFAANSMVLGLVNAEQFRERADEWAQMFRDDPRDVICVTDESLPGLPLGSLTRDYRETGIYPRAPEIIRIMAEAFADFDPIFVVFEREGEAWLKSMHNQMYKQQSLSDDYASFIDKYDPKVDWPALRAALAHEIEQGTEGRGQLVACSFEDEFAKSAVGEMTLFKLLDIPVDILASCRPQLSHINPSLPLEARPPEPLPAIVLGSSSSMLLGGWVNLLRRDYQQFVNLRNLSVPSCTTAVGLCRFLGTADRGAEAAIFWEFGANEYSQLRNGQSIELLLYHVEWLIQMCIREGRILVPILMRNSSQISTLDDPYIPAIKKLFSSYGVPVLDVQMLLNLLALTKYNPKDWYADDAHYKVDTPLHKRIAENALMLHRSGHPPVQRPDRAAHFDPLDLHLLLPENAPQIQFSNKTVSVPYVPFESEPQVQGSGRALVAMIVTSGSGPAIEIECGDDITLAPISTQVPFGTGIQDRQLRQIILSDKDRDIQMNEQLAFRPVSPKVWPQTQDMFCWKTPAATKPNPLKGNGLAAVLCEVPHTRKGN
ncbi:MAG: SGNH/GDSL hydrolase family protein [Sulfitobacter sp.]